MKGPNDEGVEVLRNRLRETIETDNQIVAMLASRYDTYIIPRAQIEEEYGKKLVRLAKGQLGETEIGSTRNVLDTTKLEIERCGQGHLALAEEIKMQLLKPLNDFLNHQAPIRYNVIMLLSLEQGSHKKGCEGQIGCIFSCNQSTREI